MVTIAIMNMVTLYLEHVPKTSSKDLKIVLIFYVLIQHVEVNQLNIFIIC